MKFSRTLAVGAVSAAALGGFVLNAGSASATHYSGCVWNAACLYYSPGLAGSNSSWDGPKDSYGSQNHLSAGAGQGQNVANNSASGWNTKADLHLRVYVNTNQGGYWQVMGPVYDPDDSISFNPTLRNNNESHIWAIN